LDNFPEDFSDCVSKRFFFAAFLNSEEIIGILSKTLLFLVLCLTELTKESPFSLGSEYS
jgi:hypothetical protein